MIITTDDFGFHEQANVLVRRAIDEQFVTHVSTMVNMPGSAEALSVLTDRRTADPLVRKGITFGLHLNLTEGRPLSDPATVRSLVNQDGTFVGWQSFIRRAVGGILQTEELQRETEAQLDRLEANRATYLFFNSHHHVHLWPSVAAAVTPVIKRYPIQTVRHPQRLWGPALGERYGSKAAMVIVACLLHKPAFERLSMSFVDFDWIDPIDRARRDALARIPVDAELSCHPHVYTEPSVGTPAQTESSLAWLLNHRDLLGA